MSTEKPDMHEWLQKQLQEPVFTEGGYRVFREKLANDAAAMLEASKSHLRNKLFGRNLK